MNGLFWELRQQHMIRDAQSAAAEGRHQADRAKWDAQDLEERLEKLTLVCRALWSLVQEKTGLTEEDLNQRVRELDAMDGQADGKLNAKAPKCPHCGRTISPKHGRCLYCGASDVSRTAFDATQ